ncbi:RHS repeat-associated core domain-containing protein [Streptomyces sp. NPDC050658]|uniref:RHS repeat-associated core domain-containing protein n=1 Tax=unclassified Streptomyces TaxID=2593676 RepID=UPI003419262F
MAGNRPADWHVLDLDKDPTPGDPDRVRGLAKNLHDFADDVSKVLRDIKGMAGEDAILTWAGKTAESFTAEFEDAPGKLKKLKKSYDMAGDAMAAYWPELERAQALADKALTKGREAQGDLSSAQSRLTSADSWVDRAGKEADKYKDDDDGGGSKAGKDVPKPDPDKVKAATRNATAAEKAQSDAKSDVSNAQSNLDAAKKMAEDARKMRENAAGTAKKKLEEASDAGIQNRKWWEEVGDWVSDNWDTIVAVCKVVVAVLGVIAMIVGGPILGAIVLVAALVVLADTLHKYANGEAGLLDVAFAALDCIPGMKGLTTLGGLAKGLKGGLAAIKGGMKGLGAAARGLGGRARGMLNDAVGGAKNMFESSKDAFGRLKDKVSKGGTDPVDLATGKMFLPQTDILLPGLLPLGFKRRAESGYRAGWWFGPSWSSTLDQHVEVDELGVIFVAEDGQLLSYPHPTAIDDPVLPEAGAPWPLRSLEDGGYEVVNPLTGLVRRFAPPVDGTAVISRFYDRNDNSVEFEYDAFGTPLEIRHSAGYRLKPTVESGRVIALALVEAGEGGSDVTVRRFGYTDGNLTEVYNTSDRPLRYEYDDRARITAWVDRNDSRYSYEYDAADRCVAEGGAGGHFELEIDYDGEHPDFPGMRVTTVTTADGVSSRHVVNAAFQVVAEIDPLGNTTRYEYDERHHLLVQTDALGRVTAFLNDDAGRPTRITRPDGNMVEAEYNSLGLLTVLRLADGSGIRQGFDDCGNRTYVTDPAGATTTFAYDDGGRLTSITDPDGNSTEFLCNAAGLPIEVSDPLGGRVRSRRDAFGRLIRLVDADGSVTRMWWTAEGSPSRRIGPSGAEEAWTYDDEGNCLLHTDEMGGQTHYEYTHFDLLVAQTGPDGARQEFEHDAALRLTKVIGAQGLAWTYEYDEAGRLAAESDFDGRRVEYIHDAAGRLTARVNASGQRVTYERDMLGRIATKEAAGRRTVFEHDAVGRLLRAENADTAVEFMRDARGRTLKEVSGSRVMSFVYDALGRRIQRITPVGAETSYAYDSVGRRTSMTTAGRTFDFTHDAVGRETLRVLDGGVLSLAQAWDESGRLVEQSLTSADNSLVQHRAYSYRADGYLTGIEDRAGGPRRFDVDAVGRVTAVQAQGWTEGYAYDSSGNQTHASWPEGHAAGDAQGDRAYTGASLVRAGRVHYEYDRDGRITLKRRVRLSRKPDIWRYQWDAEDRLTEVTTPDGTVWRYRYDPFGRRIAKQRLGADPDTVVEETRFAWDGDTLAEQTTTAPGLPSPITLTWDHRGLHPIAQTERRIDALTAEEVDSRFFAIVTDLVGTPVEMVDEQGAIAWRTRSTVWGSITWNSDATAYTPLRFPGQYHDPETGLHYNRHRHYDPDTGHYVSPDPLGLTPAPNHRAYVHNPHTWADPLGLEGDCGTDIALGLESTDDNPMALAEFGMERGALTYHDWPGSGSWHQQLRGYLGTDSNARIHFNLDGIDDPVASARAGDSVNPANDFEGLTNWELSQARDSPHAWDRISWYRGGQTVANPFA